MFTYNCSAVITKTLNVYSCVITLFRSICWLPGEAEHSCYHWSSSGCAGCHGAGVHMWTTNRLTGSETERWCWEVSTHLSTHITSDSWHSCCPVASSVWTSPPTSNNKYKYSTRGEYCLCTDRKIANHCVVTNFFTSFCNKYLVMK